MERRKYKTVDEYFDTLPKDVREILAHLRKTIREEVPEDAWEVISYNMPSFKWHGMLPCYFAYKNHIGFYPGAAPVREFKDDLVRYKTSKGAIQFPIDKKVPVGLVKKIVRFRVKEILEKEKQKRESKQKTK